MSEGEQLNGANPFSCAFEILPAPEGIVIALSEVDDKNEKTEKHLAAALSPHQARMAAMRLLALTDALSEPKTFTVLVVTAAEAWCPGQKMVTERIGDQLNSAFIMPFGNTKLATPKQKKLILPGR